MILDKSFHTIGRHIKFSTFPNNPYFVVGEAQSPHQNVLSTTPTTRYTKARLTTLSRFKVVARFKGCLWGVGGAHCMMSGVIIVSCTYKVQSRQRVWVYEDISAADSSYTIPLYLTVKSVRQMSMLLMNTRCCAAFASSLMATHSSVLHFKGWYFSSKNKQK